MTAQRRDESLSRTPVAVAVISADTLAKANIASEQDLRFATPGLAVRSNAVSNQQNYALRGQSQDAFSGTRPGVLPYLNEVQIGGGGGASAFYDLQSIQVLKGPQGTLFGRSATGGAVLFTTAKPTDTLGGYASVLGGNYGALKVEGAVNMPISGDRLMARVAGFYQRRDGFQHNLFFNDERVGKFDRLGGRVSVTARIGDAIRDDLVFDYFRSRSENTVGTISGILPFTGNGTAPFVPAQLLYAGISTPAARATGIATLQAFSGAPLGAAAAYYNAYFADPLHPSSGLSGVLASQLARGPYVVDTNGANDYTADNYIVTNTTEFDIGPHTSLKNIFGFTSLKSNISLDSDGTPFSVADSVVGSRGGNINDTRQISDEMQLSGKAITDRLDYSLGFFFSDERVTSPVLTRFFDVVFGGIDQYNDALLTYRTYAGYGQGTFRLNDSGLAVTAGLRYSSERTGKMVLPTDSARLALGNPAPPGFNYDQARTFNNLSWTFGLQDQANDDLLLYAASRRAYKSGGFNKNVTPLVGNAEQGGDAFGAERVTDAEVGAKYHGHLGDVPTRLSVAVFHDWVADSQRTAYTIVSGAPATLTVNVPAARIYGLELEGNAAPAHWLTLGATFNYTHSRYSNGAVFVVGQQQLFDQVPDAPRVSGTLFAEIKVPLKRQLVASLVGDVYHQSSFFTTPRSFNYAGTTVPSYTLANFRIGIETIDNRWSLTANLKNAFDKVYYVGGLAAGEVYQANTFVVGEPRTFTIEARLNF